MQINFIFIKYTLFTKKCRKKTLFRKKCLFATLFRKKCF